MHNFHWFLLPFVDKYIEIRHLFTFYKCFNNISNIVILYRYIFGSDTQYYYLVITHIPTKDIFKKLNDSSSQVKNISWLFIQVTKGHSIYHLTKTMMRKVTYKTSSKVSISSSFDFSTIAIAVRCRPVADDICIFSLPFTKSVLNC